MCPFRVAIHFGDFSWGSISWGWRRLLSFTQRTVGQVWNSRGGSATRRMSILVVRDHYLPKYGKFRQLCRASAWRAFRHGDRPTPIYLLAMTCLRGGLIYARRAAVLRRIPLSRPRFLLMRKERQDWGSFVTFRSYLFRGGDLIRVSARTPALPCNVGQVTLVPSRRVPLFVSRSAFAKW